MRIQRIFITGASGFLGSHLTQALKKKRYVLGTFDKDLVRYKDVELSLKQFQPDIIYHLGALVNLSRNFEVANTCIDVNVKGTLNVLEACRSLHIQRFIYTSTEEVYGDSKIPYKESFLPDPPSPYAVSKIASENLIKLYAHELSFEAVILRIGTIYGPHQNVNRFIPQIIAQALTDTDIPLNSGKKKRDYIYIDDTVEALIKAKNCTLPAQYQILNLGGGKTYSLKYLVQRIMKISKSNSKLLWNSFPDRILESDEWLMDLRNAKKILKWYPHTSLDNGLRKMIASYK